MGLLHVMTRYVDSKESTPLIDGETARRAIAIADYYMGQVVSILKLYSPDAKKFNEIQLTLIRTLFSLRHEVRSAYLDLKIITTAHNTSLPEELTRTEEKVRSTLAKEFGLAFGRNNENQSALVWERSKLEKLFAEANLTEVPEVPEVPTVTDLSDLADGEVV